MPHIVLYHMIRWWNRSALIFCLTLLPCVESFVHIIWVIEPDNSAVGQRCCCGHRICMCCVWSRSCWLSHQISVSVATVKHITLVLNKVTSSIIILFILWGMTCNHVLNVRNYDIQITSVMVILIKKNTLRTNIARFTVYVTFIGCLSLNL